jgi:anti-anti-sigma factor
MSFDCTIEQQGDLIVVAPEGEIDLANAALFREVLRQVVERKNGGRIVVDMRDVTFLDSSGLGMLVAAQRAATAKGIELRLADPNPIVRMTLEVANLADLLIGVGQHPTTESPVLPDLREPKGA